MLPRVRIALVANTESGRRDAAAAVTDALRGAGAEVQEVGLDEFCGGPETIDTGRLADVARRLADTVERVVVAGGDGSVGPAAALAAALDVPLAVVPTGTANDFARFLELPLDVDEAARIAADPAARTRTAELARAGDERPFVNAATAGLSVLAATGARPFKSRLGRFAYAVGAVRAAAAGRPLHVVIRCDGSECFRGGAWQVVVAATGAFGGGSATGGVDPHDHELDVAVVEAGSRVKLARRAWAMRRQRLVDDPGTRHVRGARVEIDGAERFNVDGEVMRVTPARFSVAETVKVIVG